MGCESCGSAKLGTSPPGCRNNGSCSTGGCNKLNTFDWLATMPLPREQRYEVYEVSFKNGSRKEFFRNNQSINLETGDMVAVETDAGFDVGRISLSGELAKLQVAKRKAADKRRRQDTRKILRKARYNDISKLEEARALEDKTMFRAREIAMDLKLEMKIGDVEFQADRRKATFYYTAEDRVDFRELIKRFAREFQVKVEMRQIGARQEAGKIGGIGSCGRELCCSTWLTEFKSVSTAAARYQNLAINQTKLSGQCGRLKCCLNFELDTYMEALKVFPKGAKVLRTEDGDAFLQKTDIFRGLMHYTLAASSQSITLEPEKVREILELNKKDELAPSLVEFDVSPQIEEEEEPEFIDDARVSLRTLERSSRKKRRSKGRGQRGRGQSGDTAKSGDGKSGDGQASRNRRRGRGKPKSRPANEDKSQGNQKTSSRRSGRRSGNRQKGGQNNNSNPSSDGQSRSGQAKQQPSGEGSGRKRPPSRNRRKGGRGKDSGNSKSE